MSVILDTGALIAFDRGDRVVTALVKAGRERRDRFVTSSGCVAQAWRGDGPRHALLVRLLRGVDEQPLGRATSRSVGELCAQTRSNDVVDAHLAMLAMDNDTVVTSDVSDLQRLLRARGSKASVHRC